VRTPRALILLATLLLSMPLAAQEGPLSVPLPDDFPSWPGADRVSFYALVGNKLAEGMAGDASVLFEVPAAGVQTVLLLGGPHARWAHAAEDGTWSWDGAGLVVAGKLPAKFEEAYVDVLAPLDGQVPPPFDSLYPSFTSISFDEGSFVIGVPAPGRYDLLLEAEGGKRRLLATVEAVPEAPLDRKHLPALTTRAVDFRLALTPPGKLVRAMPASVHVREVYRHMTVDAEAAPKRAGITWELPVTPRVLGGRLWVWAPGWQALRVPGNEFSEKQPVVARAIVPGRKLLVRVRDAEGHAMDRACIELRDAQGAPLVAAFAPRGEESDAGLDSTGRVSVDGNLTLFGLPDGGVTLLVGRCGESFEASKIVWDGKQDELEVVLD
jgi:hypothetical protein